MSNLYAPSALIKGVRAALIQNIARMRGSLLGRIAMLQPSTSDKEDYAWLGEPPRMSKLDKDDAVRFDAMSDADFSVENEIWAAGLRIARKLFDDQQNQIISRRIQQLAQVGANHTNRIIMTTLLEGASTACYDGGYFFTASHAARGQQTSTWSNLLTGSGTTSAQVQADIGDAIEKILGQIAENGEPFTEEVTKVAIVYPVELNKQMLEATRSILLGNTSNVLPEAFQFDLVPSARASAVDANDFYVLDTSVPPDSATGQGGDLPIILQERDGLEVTQKLDGDDAFDQEILKFKIRWRGKGTYGHPQRAVKVTNS